MDVIWAVNFFIFWLTYIPVESVLEILYTSVYIV